MARSARSWDPGSIHHVDARAHCGSPVFLRDEDREFVVERAARVFAEEGIVCFGWAILINHFHLLLRCPSSPGRAMLRIGTAIARRARCRGGGAGAVFQGRFFSSVCTTDAALRMRLAYVTANAVRHRVVPTIDALRTHPWSSLGEVLGLRDVKLGHTSATLRLFHESDAAEARRGLLELLESRARVWAARAGDPDLDDEDPDDPVVGATETRLPRRVADELSLPRTLGAIVGALPRAAAEWGTVAARRASLRAEGWTPDRLVAVVCDELGVDATRVCAGRRDTATTAVRAIVCHIASDILAWPTHEVAASVGASSSGVVQARSRGAARLLAAWLAADDLIARSRTPAAPAIAAERCPRPAVGGRRS